MADPSDPSALHRPVLVREALALLAPERGGLFVDATVGLGGHAEALLEAAPHARLLGIDRDASALAHARVRLARFGERVRLAHARFDELREVVARLPAGFTAGPQAAPGPPDPPDTSGPLRLPGPKLSSRSGPFGPGGLSGLAGVLADLGVSSLQLGAAARGFSFRLDGPLDMRMGLAERTAAELVNQASEEQLERIFSEYGEERQARRLARAIVARRLERPLATTGELKRLIDEVKGPGRLPRGARIDPATQAFQALRIAVNEELTGLETLLDQAVQLLGGGGRLVVISYHSLEDRIVKNTLRDLARGEIDQTTGRPRSESQLIAVLTRKPVRPTPEEVAWNPRSRSARLRAAKRL